MHFHLLDEKKHNLQTFSFEQGKGFLGGSKEESSIILIFAVEIIVVEIELRKGQWVH